LRTLSHAEPGKIFDLAGYVGRVSVFDGIWKNWYDAKDKKRGRNRTIAVWLTGTDPRDGFETEGEPREWGFDFSRQPGTYLNVVVGTSEDKPVDYIQWKRQPDGTIQKSYDWDTSGLKSSYSDDRSYEDRGNSPYFASFPALWTAVSLDLSEVAAEMQAFLRQKP